MQQRHHGSFAATQQWQMEGTEEEETKQEERRHKGGEENKGKRVFFLNFNLRAFLSFHKIVRCTNNIAGYT